MPVYALLAYAKAAKIDTTPQQRRAVAKLASALKTEREEME